LIDDFFAQINAGRGRLLTVFTVFFHREYLQKSLNEKQMMLIKRPLTPTKTCLGDNFWSHGAKDAQYHRRNKFKDKLTLNPTCPKP
jgi:hypothetical protein